MSWLQTELGVPDVPGLIGSTIRLLGLMCSGPILTLIGRTLPSNPAADKRTRTQRGRTRLLLLSIRRPQCRLIVSASQNTLQ